MNKQFKVRQPTLEEYLAHVKSIREARAEKASALKASEQKEIGKVMEDGTVYAGLTEDGKQRIFALPTDIGIMITFNVAAKAVKNLNGFKHLGHDNWQIPALEHLNVLYKNRDAGALKGTFKTVSIDGAEHASRYWSSSEHEDYPGNVHNVDFMDGSNGFNHKGIFQMSCRLVRLVEVQA